MEDIKTIIGKNIVFYRKREGLTQAQLAEKLNYSDKAVSKWERGEAVPDIETLRALALLFSVSVDELISFRKKSFQWPKRQILIPLLSCCLVCVVATLIYVAVSLLAPSLNKVWLAFFYALPACSIVCLIFSAIWKNHLAEFVSESTLVWLSALAIYLTLATVERSWMLFLLPVPLQVLALLWFLFRHKSKPSAK